MPPETLAVVAVTTPAEVFVATRASSYFRCDRRRQVISPPLVRTLIRKWYFPLRLSLAPLRVSLEEVLLVRCETFLCQELRDASVLHRDNHALRSAVVTRYEELPAWHLGRPMVRCLASAPAIARWKHSRNPLSHLVSPPQAPDSGMPSRLRYPVRQSRVKP